VSILPQNRVFGHASYRIPQEFRTDGVAATKRQRKNYKTYAELYLQLLESSEYRRYSVLHRMVLFPLHRVLHLIQRRAK
jgi:hypothetical protein